MKTTPRAKAPIEKAGRRLSLLLAAAILCAAAAPAGAVDHSPAPPAGLRAEHITETAADLVWDSSNGAEYIVYQIYLDGAFWGETEEPTFRLIELSPDTEYTATVAAAEDYGTPFPGVSAAVSFRTLGGDQTDPEILSVKPVVLGSFPLGTGFEALGLPDLVEVVLAGGGTKSLTVHWLEDGYDGGTAGNYTLTGGLVLDGCMNSSLIKAQATVTILPDHTVPDPPGNLQVAELTDSSVRLTWDAPSGTDADTVYWISLNSAPVGTTEELGYTLTGLTPETVYDASVAAVSGGVSSIPAPLRFTTPAQPKADPDIASVETLRLGEKPLGTAFAALGLPHTVPITFEDGNTAFLDVDWSESGYDGANVGTYTVFGALRLVGCQNPKDLKAQATVTVLPDQVRSVTAPAETSVEAGVLFADLALPAQVQAILERGAAVHCPVVWDGADYRPAVTGRQTITGNLVMPSANIINPGGIMARITVNVTDTTAPTVPAGLRVEQIAVSAADLIWDSSTDAVGVATYAVFLNGILHGTTTAPFYRLTGLTAGTPYAVTVTAADAAGNASVQSAALRFSTLPAPVPDPEIVSASVHPSHITVFQGTAFEALELPETAQVLLSTGSTIDCGVNWSTGGYNAAVPGVYTLTGTLVPPAGVSNSAHICAILSAAVEVRPDIPSPPTPKPVKYQVTATSGAGGSVSPKSAAVIRGGDTSFTILPEKGYQIASVLVNGAEAPAGSLSGPGGTGAYSLRLTDIREQTDIRVIFQPQSVSTARLPGLERHWAGDAAAFAVSHGLMSGADRPAFAPESYATQAAVADALLRLADLPQAVAGADYPEKGVTRAELAVMLRQYAKQRGLDTACGGGSLAAFADRDSIPAGAEPAIEWCVEHGLMHGRPGGLLAPGEMATRAELAVLLQRLAALEAG